MFKLLKNNKNISIDGIYTYFYFEHSRDYRTSGERHNFWELVYVDSGEISAVADNNGYILSQGDVVFHKPMEFHSMAAINNKPHNVLIITFESQSPSMDFFTRKIFTLSSGQKQILASVLKEFKSVFDSAFNSELHSGILNSEQALTYQIGISKLEHFMLELMRDNIYIKRAERENKFAKKNVENALVNYIKEYMEANIYSTLTLSDICNHFNMSKSYICQLFKHETGTSVIDYYIELKIKTAKILIREGDLNFTQIAESLGYTSLQHFTRMFKTKEKMSPSSYEKSIQ